ncbi:hypothetical protein O181_012606 [Austropuccinia psidii MF-1]|uniref:Uncharacterized protein n=1 Tax=Austropuccinia psidii MF-1 TaxID=1389203 RepID=A0A9Q3BUX0_9BASI|nr:hypothetical protein [Austropuccinia psidii MF-1]
MSYSEEEDLKQLPEASSWRKLSGTPEYDHMELIDYIDGLLNDVPSIPDYWITARLNKAFKGHASICGQRLSGHHFLNWEKELFQTKAKTFKSASGKITSIGMIIKDIIIPNRKGDIRLNPEFVVLEDVHIQQYLLGTDYQRMYDIDICKIKNTHITICANKENKYPLDIQQISTHDLLNELLNEFRESLYRSTIISKQNLTLLQMLRKMK